MVPWWRLPMGYR